MGVEDVVFPDQQKNESPAASISEPERKEAVPIIDEPSSGKEQEGMAKKRIPAYDPHKRGEVVTVNGVPTPYYDSDEYLISELPDTCWSLFPIVVKYNIEGTFLMFPCGEKYADLNALVEPPENDISMEEVFNEIRGQFDVDEADELVFTFDDLPLSVEPGPMSLGEDNYYAREVTLGDLVKLMLGLCKNTPKERRPDCLRITVSTVERFTCAFNSLTSALHAGEPLPEVEHSYEVLEVDVEDDDTKIQGTQQGAVEVYEIDEDDGEEQEGKPISRTEVEIDEEEQEDKAISRAEVAIDVDEEEEDKQPQDSHAEVEIGAKSPQNSHNEVEIDEDKQLPQNTQNTDTTAEAENQETTQSKVESDNELATIEQVPGEQTSLAHENDTQRNKEGDQSNDLQDIQQELEHEAEQEFVEHEFETIPSHSESDVEESYTVVHDIEIQEIQDSTDKSEPSAIIQEVEGVDPADLEEVVETPSGPEVVRKSGDSRIQDSNGTDQHTYTSEHGDELYDGDDHDEGSYNQPSMEVATPRPQVDAVELLSDGDDEEELLEFEERNEDVKDSATIKRPSDGSSQSPQKRAKS